MQAPAGSSKAAKFQALNPLDPIINPFPESSSNEQQDDFQKISALTDNRLQNKNNAGHLGHGNNEQQTGQNNFLGHNRSTEQPRRNHLQKNESNLVQDHKLKLEREVSESSEDADSDEEWLNELESDPALEALREQRIEQMKLQQLKLIENRTKGHGEYRTISQDEFLPETTGSSEWTVVHFYHDDFEKCKIMDHHLKIISEKYLECKFLRINSLKSPFFCSKLTIRTLPTVLVFQNGETKGRLVGFEGISDGIDWPTKLLAKWLGETGAIHYSISLSEAEKEMERLDMVTPAGRSIWRGETQTYEDDEA